MQRDDPSAPGIKIERGGEPARLTGGDHPERIGEGKIRVGVRIENRDPEVVLIARRQDQRKQLVPKAPEAGGPAQAPQIRERFNRLAMRSERFRRAWAELSPPARVTRTLSPCKLAIADSARILRRLFAWLNGRSRRAGFARSTMLRS